MTLDNDSAILTLPPSPPESLAPGNLALSPSSSPPSILLRFPLHRRASRILHLEPIGRASWTVARVLALRDNAFEAHFAGMGEDGRAITLHVLIEPDAGGQPWR